jgi:hypothetical protein
MQYQRQLPGYSGAATERPDLTLAGSAAMLPFSPTTTLSILDPAIASSQGRRHVHNVCP